MATLTTTIKLASSDLSTNTLALTTTATQSPTGSSGLSRAKITSTSKVSIIGCSDGDDNRTTPEQEGQYIDITDNHGVLRRYVFIDGSASTVATGTIILNDTDVGSTSTPASNLIGGIAVDTGDHANVSQAMELQALKDAIEHANGHAGSITVALSGTATGPQTLTLTNGVTGEGGSFIIDKANSALPYLTAATNSQADHVTIVAPSTYASNAYLYIKNTATNAAHTATIYNAATLGQDDLMVLAGGQSAFFPINIADNLKAYTSNSGTIVEFMHVGIE